VITNGKAVFDTSAQVKLYRIEANSPQVRACFTSGDTLVIAQVTLLEFPSAFYGLVRQHLMTMREAMGYISAFCSDLPHYDVVVAHTNVIQEAQRLLDTYAVTHNLRPMDSLQLATAIVVHRFNPLDAFVTTDKVLVVVAQLEGMTVKP
jgi:predicted nucleic acid-binding protein